MTNTEDHCPICELAMSEALTVVSRHRTSTGTVVYARCECGRLSMWREPAPHEPPLLTIGPAATSVGARTARGT